MSTAATTAIESNMEKVANTWAKAQGLTGVTYTGELWGQNITYTLSF